MHAPGSLWFAASHPNPYDIGRGDTVIATAQTKDDARLFAAAPAMLSVLTEARDELAMWLDFAEGKDADTQRILDEIDAVIARATGE